MKRFYQLYPETAKTAICVIGAAIGVLLLRVMI